MQSASVPINDEDMQGLMEVSHGLKGDNLDLILHSPGGSAEATEAIVSYLRSRFSHIRVIVPHLAMSAATMIACAADEIVLGEHSFLSPTDPQFTLSTPSGVRMVPAQAILDEFFWARQDCSLDPTRQSVWTPMLNQYGPGLLQQCKSALEMSKNLSEKWLHDYMFRKMDDKQKKAKEISSWLSDHKNFMSHSRHIPRDEIENRGLVVSHLENDQSFRDLVLSVFHAATHTFSHTLVTKIIESHTGRAFLNTYAVQPPPTG